MSSEEPFGSPSPTPFGEAPRSASGAASRAKPFLIGCGLLVVLAAAALVVLVAKSTDLLAWGLSRVEEQVVANLPRDVTEAELERLETAFDGARESLAERRIDPVALEALQTEVLGIGRSQPGDLTREDVLRLIEVLERLALAGEPAEEDPPTAAEAAPTSV